MPVCKTSPVVVPGMAPFAPSRPTQDEDDQDPPAPAGVLGALTVGTCQLPIAPAHLPSTTTPLQPPELTKLPSVWRSSPFKLCGMSLVTSKQAGRSSPRPRFRSRIDAT